MASRHRSLLLNVLFTGYFLRAGEGAKEAVGLEQIWDWDTCTWFMSWLKLYYP